ncbi:response regulator [Pedobacter cryophilus]|uniref:histidine kinase n=1 Tax=Pedobacter cryophilus TaxID=2571271 RepID=A0A4U1BU10_9SPHI|nr:response regulator [Pedobacter cryophilus]TKB95516.1 response regulator [Pedobacter cryophilus]
MIKFSFKVWIAIGITLSLGLVFFIGTLSYLSLQNLKSDQELVMHTTNVISTADLLKKEVVDLETGQRGFIITGNEEFLEAYNKALPKIAPTINKLSTLISDNPSQAVRMDSLNFYVNQRIETLNSVINLKRQPNFKVDESVIATLRSGKQKMDKIRKLVNDIIKTESVILEKRQNDANYSISRTSIIIIIGSSLIFLVVAILFKFISDAFKGQSEAKNNLNSINYELVNLSKANEEKAWILIGISKLNEEIQGELSIEEMTSNIISIIAEYAKSKVATIYLAAENEQDFELKAGYAFTITANTKKKFKLNETWIGQVAADKKPVIIKGELIKNLEISTGLITSQPLESLIIPFYFNNKVKGILEFGFDNKVGLQEQEFIKMASDVIGVAINTAQSRAFAQALFEETQIQAEELSSQQEELRMANDELVTKTQMLQSSEEELRVQQEELKEINFELEERAKLLLENNQVIEEARASVFIKMEELEQSGKYKTEFLANMSHELRTPLNSILILARILKDNKEKNLSAEEAKYANVIYKAGNDLLSLINDILDLAKIESGKLDFTYEEVALEEIKDDLIQLFYEVATDNEIKFDIEIDTQLPQTIEVDKQRIEQILKNLLSNAFKFTPKNGEVKVVFSTQKDSENIEIKVIDNGIGIPEEKQKLIFEAFQQVDGSTSRKFGGTGLGLSISKELAQKMNGFITLESKEDNGSVFSLIIPIKVGLNQKSPSEKTSLDLLATPIIKQFKPVFADPEHAIIKEKPLILIVEDDLFFNHFLKGYVSRKGFEAVQVYDGESAIEKALEIKPDAILLDIMLPGIDGWAVLKRLKSEASTQLIPIHMMSAGDQREQKAIHSGALSFLKKPVDKDALDKIFTELLSNDNLSKNILLIEDKEAESEVLANLFRSKNIKVQQAFNGQQALMFLEEQEFDCLILDLNLPDISGFELLERIKIDDRFKDLPVIINTAMDLDQEEMNNLVKHANATIMKSSKSGDRLIDEVNLFLHQIKKEDGKISKPKRSVHNNEIKNKTILLVDDDMRNIFALSAILDTNGYKLEIANNGIEALEKLHKVSAIDLVLMDIMMPKMDGLEAMRRIRANPILEKLPVIALTAKAMKEDKDQCIAAGANEYITKPIDTDKLLALVKVWIA